MTPTHREPCSECFGDGQIYLGHPNDPWPKSRECSECRGSGIVLRPAFVPYLPLIKRER